MKLLKDNELVELLQATEADKQLMALRMERIRDGKDAYWLKDPTRRVMAIANGGKKVGAYEWFFSRANKCLVICNGASFVTDLSTFPMFMRAFKIHAAQLGATSLTTITRRAGLVQKYLGDGWFADGVAMSKTL